MVTRSLFTGVSGLQTHMQKMDSLSNNLSNLNTPGFKKSSVTFKSFLSQQVTSGSSPDVQENVGGTNPQQVGLGVQMGSINLDMSQGQLQRTGINTDLAVQGDGFFTARKSGGEQNLFTRSGSFQFDSQSQLVDPSNGNVVQGYMANPEENFVLGTEGNPEDIKLTSDMRNMQADSTTSQLFEGNLSADQETGIDSVKASFTPEGSSNESEIRYDFKRFHPEKKLYHFEAVWTKNPPTGKQIGSSVKDQVTGRKLEGVVRLNDDGQVTEMYKNSDRSNMNGIGRLEVPEGNTADFSVQEDGVVARDQRNIFEDLPDDAAEPLQFRMTFGYDQDGNGTIDGSTFNYDINGDGTDETVAEEDAFSLQYQTVEGDWQNLHEDADTGDRAIGDISQITGGSGYTLRRDREDTPQNEFVREGEIRFDGDFMDVDANNIERGEDGDKIFFQIHKGEAEGAANNIFEQEGEESKPAFRWGGPNNGSKIVTKPQTVNGGGSLNSVFNFSEANIGEVSDTTNQNSIENKEFLVDFDGGAAAGNPDQFQVVTDLETASGDNTPLENQDGDTTMNINEDNILVNPDSGNELGVTIGAENWQETANIDDNTEVQFQVNEGRSVDAENVRPYSLVTDAEGNTAPILMSEGTPESPGGLTFSPDTAGVLDQWSVDTGETAEATLKSDQQIQLAASSDAYDSQGKQHTLTYRFEKQDTNTWMWHVQDPAPVDQDNPKMAGFGKLQFNSEGSYKLTSQTFKSKVAKDRPPAGPQGDKDMNNVWFNPPAETLQGGKSEEGAAPVNITPDFESLTQYGGTSDAEISEQDGNAAGKLESLNFDQTGSLNGSYDNGESRVLAQVALARFRNAEGLSKQGSTYFADSANSGQARFNPPGKGGRGSIAPGSLERSNVDLSAQFTQMISTQRGFQANTKTIRTSDQMIQQLLRLK